MAYKVIKSFSIFEPNGSFRVVNEGQVIDGVWEETENFLQAGIITVDEQNVDHISDLVTGNAQPVTKPSSKKPTSKK